MLLMEIIYVERRFLTDNGKKLTICGKNGVHLIHYFDLLNRMNLFMTLDCVAKAALYITSE